MKVISVGVPWHRWAGWVQRSRPSVVQTQRLVAIRSERQLLRAIRLAQRIECIERSRQARQLDLPLGRVLLLVAV